MSSSGVEKEVRMPPGSFSFNPLIPQTLDQHHVHDILTQHHKLSDPDTISPISVGSVLKSPPVRYHECLKNHAANLGGNVTDGCGEFMPAGEDGTMEALKCAACNCHRNFHRKDDADFHRITIQPLHLPPALPSPSVNQHRRVPYPNHHWNAATQAPVKMGFSGGNTSSSEDLNCNTAGPPIAPPYHLPKKRFRTKFTQEQKEKMMEFAEKVCWRIPREDDPGVQTFCAEVGIKRKVLKVWMHNNKASAKSKLQETNGD